MQELPKAYDQSKENDIYKLWEMSGYFNPDNLQGDPYTIIMPPPNVTGVLHVGHSLMLTIQDLIIRYERMRGKKTLWLPGTDHAAIATQSKVESIIKKEEDKSRHDLGREEFLRRVEEYAKNSHDTIVKQMKGQGASADWSREAYTLDEARNKAVRTGFKKMYDDGLIYRGMRVINWDVKGQTAISDDEIVYKPEKGQLFYFKYSEDFPIEIATTRPETKVGDTAVAVHPSDERYQQYIGKTFNVEFAGTKLSIQVIADESIDPEYGTGALGVTPAHSMIDYELGQKHALPMIQVINEFGKMMDSAGTLVAGLKAKEAREKIVEWLSHNGLLRKIDFIDQNISTAERTGGVIEPLPKLQWFINVNKPVKIEQSKIEGIKPGDQASLKDLMLKVVETGQIKIMPEHEDKKYRHWINNLKDWNISRQIWYGHRIPAWFKGDEIHVGTEAPSGEGWEQDPDTLDTWFSSGMWTFSTLGWPEQTSDLQTFHPTNTLVTAYDILFFWVARMIMMTTYMIGDVPFKTVYLHGLVRDEKRQKISKSLGNNIDPLEIAHKYGVDALRMAVLVGVLPGADIAMSENKIKGYRNFANKIWNVSRFVYQNTDDYDSEKEVKLSEEDQKIIDEVNKLTADTTALLEKLDLAHASENLYHFVWHRFADEIIEKAKEKLADEAKRESAQKMLLTALEIQLKLLHPFTPFVTEAIWQFKHRELLMIQPWPVK